MYVCFINGESNTSQADLTEVLKKRSIKKAVKIKSFQ